MKFVQLYWVCSMMPLGDAGGCGFCPPAAPGIQGDRGSLGYRGRPGVSINRKSLIDFLSWYSFISSFMEHPATEVCTLRFILNQHCLMMICYRRKRRYRTNWTFWTKRFTWTRCKKLSLVQWKKNDAIILFRVFLVEMVTQDYQAVKVKLVNW